LKKALNLLKKNSIFGEKGSSLENGKPNAGPLEYRINFFAFFLKAKYYRS